MHVQHSGPLRPILSCLAIIIALLLASCAHEVPAPTGIADSASLAPVGIPDWNGREYSWIDGLDGHCSDYGVGGRTPAFTFRVTSISSDERELALVSPVGISLYNLLDGSWYRLVNGAFRTARFSHSGFRIAALYASPSTGLAILDLYNQQYYEIPLPEFIDHLGTSVEWLPGDTALVVTWIGSAFDPSEGAIAVRSAYPFNYEDFPLRTSEGYLFSSDEALHLGPITSFADETLSLGVTALNDSTPLRSVALTGLQQFRGGSVSADGHWLAFNTQLDMRGSPFPNFLQHQHLLPALAVVDLRPGSPTRDRIFRVFPDPANARRTCASLWSYGAAPITSNGRFIYQEYLRDSDGTTQIARRDVATGAITIVSDFGELP